MRPLEPGEHHGSRGVTLVELLAALLISGFVVVLAARIFLTGNRQYLQRFSESERLAALYRIKAGVQGALNGEVERCSGGKLWLRSDSGEMELAPMLKAHYPGMASADFRCFDTGSDSSSLVEWTEWFQPRLVEYKLVLGQGAKSDTLAGSMVK
jgi:prepilin-type N-terminal cleavage/methylation domain-containing protein